MMYPEKYIPDFESKDFNLWVRVVHLEHRYLNVNQLLADLNIKNILELSSGFSFRGLDIVKQRDVHYIDTDLPAVVEQKKQFVVALQGELPTKGNLEIRPLNALNENEFLEVISRFGKGEIVIVNEGLLMYLNMEEKMRLCSTIHKVLKERGGYWITADIYIRFKQADQNFKLNDKFQEFLDEHRTEENKFESIESTEAFFKDQGFAIDKEAVPEYTKLSTLDYMIKSMSPELMAGAEKAKKIHTTWRLKVTENIS